MKKVVLLLIFVFLFYACAPAEPAEPTGPLTLTSSAFTHEGPIPANYTCTGKNTSPAFSWTQPPTGTKSFALIMDDPDAPGAYVHWVIFNIPASARGLDETIPKDAELEDGSVQGRSSTGMIGYFGPCPPAEHHYSFRLYALDSMLSLTSDANREAVLTAMEGHVLASAELIGTFNKYSE